jgi:hypothetical protein
LEERSEVKLAPMEEENKIARLEKLKTQLQEEALAREVTLLETAKRDWEKKEKERSVAEGEVKKKRDKNPVWIFIAIGLSAFFSLVCAPFLASGANPDGNVGQLKVLVADFDKSTVGTAFLNFIKEVPSHVGISLPTFKIVEARDLDDLSKMVLHQEGWAALYVSSSATQNLMTALGNGCLNTDSYDSTLATGFIYDEGRSLTEAKIFGYLVYLMPKFSTAVSTYILSQPNAAATVTSCLSKSGGPAFIANPIGWDSKNLTPISKAPVVNNALAVGNILIAVFCALFIVNALWKAVPVDHLNTIDRSLWRCFLMIFYVGCLAAVFSTIVVGLAKTGSGNHLYDGNVWAQVWAIQWAHGIIWAFGTAAWVEATALEAAALPFAFLLISSIMGGWCVDISDPGYHQFYQIFPFNWSIILMRNVYYGSHPTMVGRAVGALVGESSFFVVLYLFLSNRKGDAKKETVGEKSNEMTTQIATTDVELEA